MATSVEVNILSARDILAADSNGFSDPYISMTFVDSQGNTIAKGGSYKTKVIKKTLSPEWNERFIVGDTFDLREATTLRLLMQDSDGFFGKNDVLGVVDIPIDLITNLTEPLDNWFNIMKVEGKMKKDAKGQLRVIITPQGMEVTPSVRGSGVVLNVDDEVSNVRPLVSASNEPPNLLYVTLRNAKDLLAMDGGITSDPLIKLTLAGQKHQSSTKQKTLKPQWNEKFAFVMTDANNTLQLIVEDHDVTINDFMGRADFSLAGIEPNVEKTVTLEFGDKKGRKDNKERGTVTFSCIWTYDPQASNIAAKKKDTSIFTKIKGVVNPGLIEDDDLEEGIEVDDNTVKKSEEELEKEREERKKKEDELMGELKNIEIKSGDYMIQVHVIQCKDLVAKDSTGTSDPVVYVNVLGEEQRTSAKKQVLSCVWDDLLIFPMRNLDKDEVSMGSIKLDVMDANTIQRAELIGSAQFDISYVYSHQNHQIANAWVALTDTTSTINQGVQGYLRFSITVVGPGDKLVPPPSPFSGDGDGIENLIMPSAVTQKVQFVVAQIHQAEELPPMDTAVVGKSGLDAYITASIGGGEMIKTRVKSKKGARHELSPIFNEALMLVVREPSMADTIKLGIMDWDRVGRNEVVGHVYESLKMVKALGGLSPRWYNIYGAPLKGAKDSITGGSVKEQMNKHPDMATTYRGRLLMSMKIDEDLNDERDEVNDKYKIKPLPRNLHPKTELYVMRAHFVSGSEIPKVGSAKALGQISKMSLVMSCGTREISTDRVKNNGGVCEWNVIKQSEPMALPEDLSQVPDIFLYLCRGEGDGRRAVCYYRVSAKELMGLVEPTDADRNPLSSSLSGSRIKTPTSGFTSEVQWIAMKEDPAIDALKDTEFPGNVLVRLGFGTKKDAEANPWNDADVDRVNKRTPYQVRAHIYQGRGLPAADANGLLDPYLIVRCLGEEKKTKFRRKTRDPEWYETITFELDLPDLIYAPQVILRLMDHDDGFDADDYVGCCMLNLSEGHIRSSADLHAGKYMKLPPPSWHDLQYQEKGDSEGKILTHVELIRKQFPDEEVPRPLSITPETRKAFIEITILGLRDMEPFQFLPIQFPFMEFVLGASDHASHEMRTEASKQPSPQNPNFLQRILKEVELPKDAFFAPRLNIMVKDVRLGGFQKPIIGSASVDMENKIPWSKTYKPPQSDSVFQEFDIVAQDEGDVSENTRLLHAVSEVDDGAGVFGALKGLGVDFNIEEPQQVPSGRVSSVHNDEEDEDTKKYLKHREVLDGDLESELKTTPFEKYALHIGQHNKKASMLASLNPFTKKKPVVSSTSGSGTYKIAGKFKGLIRVILNENEKPLIDLETVLKPQPYEIRVYVLEGTGFAPMDLSLNGRPGKSDPYLKLQLGKDKISDRKNYIEDTTDPDFYKMFQFNTSLPGASVLKIDALDYDFIGGDDLIGSTSIDLEDRLFDKRWQKMGQMYETANRLRLKPLEVRDLKVSTSKAIMGQLKMWVDILTPAAAVDYPKIDISLPPPLEMELRVIVWKAKNVPNFDEAEQMNDLFFRVWMEASDDKKQDTDIHWRAKKGKGSFNYRMKIPITLGHKQPDEKYPYFHIQAWDKDVFTSNDAIGDETLDLGVYFKKAYKRKAEVQCFEDDPETAKRKNKVASDDDAAVKKIKEATGLWDDSMDPPDSKWLKLGAVDPKTRERKYMGEVCISLHIVPLDKAKRLPVGHGRQAPNHSPYLPPPAGRLSFSLNPFKVFNDLLGPSICNRIMCCLCCVAFMAIVYVLAPFIQVGLAIL